MRPSCYGKKLGANACFHNCPVRDECYREEAGPKTPSAILFDGYRVYQALSPKARQRTSAENVSDVLDAAVAAWRSGGA